MNSFVHEEEYYREGIVLHLCVIVSEDRLYNIMCMNLSVVIFCLFIYGITLLTQTLLYFVGFSKSLLCFNCTKIVFFHKNNKFLSKSLFLWFSQKDIDFFFLFNTNT